jgi:hypothetical protein
MQLIQSVLRCVTGPSRAAVQQSTRHHVVHHIGEAARHPIHRIAAYTQSGFGSVCRYVAVAVGIGAGAVVPPVAAAGLLPPPVPLSVTGDFGPGKSGRSSEVSGAFSGSVGSQDITGQAPFDSPFQFIGDTFPGADNLPLYVVVPSVADRPYPILPTTNIPSVVTSVPPIPPKQTVAEPPAFGLLLIGFLAILWRQAAAASVRNRLAVRDDGLR